MNVTVTFHGGPLDAEVELGESWRTSIAIWSREHLAFIAYQCGEKCGVGHRISSPPTVPSPELSEYVIVKIESKEQSVHILAEHLPVDSLEGLLQTTKRHPAIAEFVVRKSRERHGLFELLVGGLPVEEHDYEANQLVRIAATRDEVMWTPEPDRSTPLVGRLAVWNARQYVVDAAYIKRAATDPQANLVVSLRPN